MNSETSTTTNVQPQGEPAIYRELTKFFELIIAEKNAYKQELEKSLKPSSLEPELARVKMTNGFPLLDKDQMALDIPSMKKYLHTLSALAHRHAPNAAEVTIEKLIPDDTSFETMIRAVLREEAIEPVPGLLTFLITETIRPVLEIYAACERETISTHQWEKGYCPICGSDPLLGFLRGEEGRRYLVCSLCATEWQFSRIKCPFCENSDFQTLSYFVADNDQRCRIEVCEECKRYIKTVDLRATAQEVFPILENIRTMHLDIIAQEKGYTSSGFSPYTGSES